MVIRNWVFCLVFLTAFSPFVHADSDPSIDAESDQELFEFQESDTPEPEFVYAPQVDVHDLLKKIPNSATLQQFSVLITHLLDLQGATEHEQEIILEKVILLFASCAREHMLQALHTFSHTLRCLEYRLDHPIKSFFVQLFTTLSPNAQSKQAHLNTLSNKYFEGLGALAQIDSSLPLYQRIDTLFSAVGLLQHHGAINVPAKINSFYDALQGMQTCSTMLIAQDAALCKRGINAKRIAGTFINGVVRSGVSLGMCAGGGFLIGKYLADLKSDDIVRVKQNYKDSVKQFHRQFNIPGVTNADIERAAENLDTSFLEDKVIPAVTHRVRTVNDGVPNVMQRAVDLRRDYMPERVEAILRKIPARTIAVATTLIWLVDKTVIDVLPWGVGTMVGVAAWGGSVAFMDRVAAVADAVITAAGGVSVAPDIGMLTALVYKKKIKLAMLKYGGGVAGAIGLYSLYRFIVKHNEQTLSQSITHNVHDIIALLTPYSDKTTGAQMKQQDWGMLLHCVDEIKRELEYLGHDARHLFKHDMHALQSLNTTARNRIQLLNSMYQTYSLHTVTV